MKQKKVFRVKSFNDLRLRIYTIGYPVMGESVLALLCDGDQVLFSVVTDCYCIGQEKNGAYNHVDTIMTGCGVTQIDAFVWTHPDEDHSLGIESLLDCYDNQHEAEIFIPEGLIEQRKKGTLCKESCGVVDYLYSHYSNRGSHKTNRHVHTVSTDDHEVRDLLGLEIYADDEVMPMTCKFRFVLPYAEFCNHANFWDMDMEHNLMSIVYSIEINGRNYLFTGDLLDEGTKMMSDEVLSRINYIKIPHHGSEHSKEFQFKVKRFGDIRTISTATRFDKKNDPKESTLRAYSELGDVYYVTNELTHKVGCIETEVDVMTDVCVTKCFGNACRFSA